MATLSFYPDHLRTAFTNRERELALLEQATVDLANGRPRHLALTGLRRIGKTLLLVEHAARLIERRDASVRPVYLDFEELVTSPELFSRHYVGLVTFWAVMAGQGDRTAFLTTAGLLGGPAAGLRSLSSALAGLETTVDDPAAQLGLALDFPDRLAEELDCRLLLLLDEFTELEVLANYPSVRRPFQIFRAAMQRHSHLGYVIAASAVHAFELLIHDGQSPLFLQFEAVEIAAFTPDATLALAERLLGATPPPGVGRRLHELTGGHPFYIQAVTTRLVALHFASGDAGGPPAPLDAADVGRAFVLETLSRSGQIYNYCRYVYDISLRRARGYGALKAILQALAGEDGLALTEVARRVRKGAPTVREYLRALVEVDLVVELEGLYRYRDPVLRYWVAAMIRGIEVDLAASRSSLAPLLVNLEAQRARLTTELGIAKESQLRELLRAFAGQTVDGAWFGLGAKLTLPHFEQVGPYRSADGQIEIEALAESSDGTRWAVELKWRGRATGEKELSSLAGKAEALAARPWVVSRSGFTTGARLFAAQHRMMVSSRADLEQIERAVLGASA